MEQTFKKVVKGAFLTYYSGYVLIGAICGLASLLSFGELLGNLNLAIYGQRVEGTVIDAEKQIIEFTRDNNRTSTFSPNVKISFEGEASKYHVGQKIDVVYTTKPYNVEIYNITHMLILPLGVAVVCGILAFILLRWYYGMTRA